MNLTAVNNTAWWFRRSASAAVFVEGRDVRRTARPGDLVRGANFLLCDPDIALKPSGLGSIEGGEGDAQPTGRVRIKTGCGPGEATQTFEQQPGEVFQATEQLPRSAAILRS